MENKKTIKVLINGKPLEDKTYFVATSNYLQGWRSYEFLWQSKEFI